MNCTVVVPDGLLPTIENWMQGQRTPDGLYFKYADVEDLMQQNANDGLLTTMLNTYVQTQTSALQAQIDALVAAAAQMLAPKKPPVHI